MYVDVPHLDCLLVAAPITLEGLDHLILKPKQLDGITAVYVDVVLRSSGDGSVEEIVGRQNQSQWSAPPEGPEAVSFAHTRVSIVGWIYDPDHSLPPGMYVDVPHLDCLLVAPPITVEGLDQVILIKSFWSRRSLIA
jgi:hypothetical protein